MKRIVLLLLMFCVYGCGMRPAYAQTLVKIGNQIVSVPEYPFHQARFYGVTPGQCLMIASDGTVGGGTCSGSGSASNAPLNLWSRMYGANTTSVVLQLTNSETAPTGIGFGVAGTGTADTPTGLASLATFGEREYGLEVVNGLGLPPVVVSDNTAFTSSTVTSADFAAASSRIKPGMIIDVNPGCYLAAPTQKCSGFVQSISGNTITMKAGWVLVDGVGSTLVTPVAGSVAKVSPTTVNFDNNLVCTINDASLAHSETCTEVDILDNTTPLQIADTHVTADVATVDLVPSNRDLQVGQTVTISGLVTAAYLNTLSAVVSAVVYNTSAQPIAFTTPVTHANYGVVAETGYASVNGTTWGLQSINLGTKKVAALYNADGGAAGAFFGSHVSRVDTGYRVDGLGSVAGFEVVGTDGAAAGSLPFALRDGHGSTLWSVDTVGNTYAPNANATYSNAIVRGGFVCTVDGIGCPSQVAHFPLATFLAAIHNYPNQAISIKIFGDSFNRCFQANCAAGPVVGTNRPAEQLRIKLQAQFGSHGTGIVPIQAEVGQGPDATEWSCAGALQYGIAAFGPYQGGAVAGTGLIRLQNGASCTFSDSRMIPFDHLNTYCMTTPSSGSLTVSVDGATTGTVCGTTTSIYAPNVETLALAGLATHTVTYTSTGDSYLYAAQGTAGTTGVEVSNLSAAGAGAEYFGLTPATQLAFLDLDPVGTQLAILELGVNEPGLGYSTASFQAAMQGIITHEQGLSSSNPPSVALIVPPQGSIGTSTLPPYTAVQLALAQSNNVAFGNVQDRWGASYTSASQASGNWSNDGSCPYCNPSDLGARDEAAFVYETIFDNVPADVSPSLKLAVYSVSSLPSAATLGAGTQVVVTDATTFTPGACTGGGSDTMIAVSNGSSWSCH